MTGFEERHSRPSSAFLVLIFAAGLIVGGIITFYITLREVEALNNEISSLSAQLSKLWGYQNVTYQNITIYQNSTALSELYAGIRDSVALVVATTGTGTAQGSGFVYNFSGSMFVITNYHVVHGATMISVTFSNGNGYAASVNGSDPYADLAVLSVTAPENEFRPLDVVGSSTLRVGDPVIAVGNPYGYVGSMTTGVISALGRTITEEDYTGGFAIANIIQTSAPINPGNSGGPLLNYCGKVIGVTTAIIKDSQGLGFAVPSNTILREIETLVRTGTYQGHSYLGLTGTDMNYETANDIDVNVTYGWRVVEVLPEGPSATSGVRNGDILVGIRLSDADEAPVRNRDDMASYLEEHTLPDQTVILKIVRREGQTTITLEIDVELGSRPPPPV